MYGAEAPMPLVQNGFDELHCSMVAKRDHETKDCHWHTCDASQRLTVGSLEKGGSITASVARENFGLPSWSFSLK
jgi:hypothetical protein